MADQRHVDYIRSNKDKYPLESLKQALIQAGASPADVDEAARLAAAPAPAPIPAQAASPERSEPLPSAPVNMPPPRDESGVAFTVGNIIEIVRSVLLEPAAFFRAMPRTGGYRDPQLFIAAMAVLSQCVFLGLRLLFGAFGLGGAFSLLGLMGSAALGLVLLPLAIFIAAWVAHVIWRLLGSGEQFETSFRCAAYVAAAAPLHAFISAIPAVGLWVAIPVVLYGIYLYVPASVEVHGVDRKRAFTAFGMLGFLVLLVMIAAGVLAGRRRADTENSKVAINAAKLKEIAESMEEGKSGGEEYQAMEVVVASATEAQEQLSQVAASALTAVAKAQDTALVDPAELESLLPEKLYGMTTGSAASSTGGAMGIKVAEAGVTYTAKGGRTITVKIYDTGGMGGMMSMGWNLSAGALASSGVTASEYKGFKTQEMYDKQTRASRLGILVGNRFVVEIKGSGGFTTANLRSVADNIDLDALKSLAP